MHPHAGGNKLTKLLFLLEFLLEFFCSTGVLRTLGTGFARPRQTGLLPRLLPQRSEGVCADAVMLDAMFLLGGFFDGFAPLAKLLRQIIERRFLVQGLLSGFRWRRLWRALFGLVVGLTRLPLAPEDLGARDGAVGCDDGDAAVGERRNLPRPRQGRVVTMSSAPSTSMIRARAANTEKPSTSVNWR